MLYVTTPRLGRHVCYDSDATRRAAMTYARGELQQSLLTGWSPWDGTLPNRPDVVGDFRPASIAGLRERLETHGFVLARLQTGRMHGIHPGTMASA